MAGPVDAVRVVLAVVRSVRDHDVEYPAASLAYYGFISLFPLLLIVLTLLSRSAATAIQSATPPFLTPGTRELVYDVMADRSGGRTAITVALAVLTWSGANLTVGFRSTVERAEGELDTSVTGRVRDALCVLGSLALALCTIVLTTVAFSAFSARPSVVAAGVVALVATLSLAFLPLYYFPSRRVTSLREALPGSLTAALGWTGLLVFAHLYAANAERLAVYGAISGIIVVLTSVYVAALLLLTGVVLNATLAGR
ncbi:YihY/virulence factor BrkB family protein [Halogeometricum limi]|uniref:Membrane protein n=1 Tax=Halogeometricum limi TaxID=555875 RepID=A0A1I6FSG1_9EURY|nr:YihY/virulence factor BrkB family protein [Halogeometricum limi]SFR32844.1 membrane protein [Halogeometricum limi]